MTHKCSLRSACSSCVYIHTSIYSLRHRQKEENCIFFFLELLHVDKVPERYSWTKTPTALPPPSHPEISTSAYGRPAEASLRVARLLLVAVASHALELFHKAKALPERFPHAVAVRYSRIAFLTRAALYPSCMAWAISTASSLG